MTVYSAIVPQAEKRANKISKKKQKGNSPQTNVLFWLLIVLLWIVPTSTFNKFHDDICYFSKSIIKNRQASVHLNQMISSSTQSKTSNLCERKWKIRTFSKQKIFFQKNTEGHLGSFLRPKSTLVNDYKL